MYNSCVPEMVCVPCIVIPFFLFIWYRFIQPLVLKFWNPWAKVESASPPVTTTDGSCPSESLNATASSEKVNGSNQVSTEQQQEEEGKKEL